MVTDIFKTDQYYLDDMMTSVLVSTYPPIPPEVAKIVVLQHNPCPYDESDPNCDRSKEFEEIHFIEC